MLLNHYAAADAKDATCMHAHTLYLPDSSAAVTVVAAHRLWGMF